MTDGRPSHEDRPDPNDKPPQLRARVPDHVADGAFSTGVIVVTGPTEFIIDFLQTVGRPHRVAARVILPHPVMPQFIDALGKNLGLYRDRFGDPPQPPGLPGPATAIGATGVPRESVEARPAIRPNVAPPAPIGNLADSPFGSTDVLAGAPLPPIPPAPVVGPGGIVNDPAGTAEATPLPSTQPPTPPVGPAATVSAGGVNVTSSPRRPTPQEIYDDLKIPDHVLSGAYANGVMIAHGTSEFSFDFLTSFYPQSAVSARIFLAAGQVPRLLDSLQQAMRQLQIQRGQPPRGDEPGSSPA
jgi:hypothetical protein